MRQAWNDKGWIHAEDGTLLGICLGYDHCAEHEWGIDQLKSRLGITLGVPLGIDDRTMRKGADQLIFIKQRKRQTVKGKRYTMPVAILATAPEWKDPESALEAYAKNPPSGIWLGHSEKDLSPDRNDIQTAWGREGFSITAIGKQAVENLEVLAHALGQLDGCVSLAGAANPFGGNGLCLTIASRIAPSVRESVLAADEAYVRLHAAASATGIRQDLAAAGVHIYALEPRWFGPGETNLKFFLNAGGGKYNHGWFTEEELRLCLEGAGPAIKTTAGRAT